MIDRVLYRCIAPRAPRTPAILAGVLLTVGLTLWVGAPRTGWWAMIRFAAIAAITGGLYVAVRWLARGYIYTLEQHDDGHVDFVVTEQNGRRQVTVCRVSTGELTGLRLLAKGERPPRPAPGRRVYHYCAAMRPDHAALLILHDGEGESILHFTPDDGLSSLLRTMIPAVDENVEKSW